MRLSVLGLPIAESSGTIGIHLLVTPLNRPKKPIFSISNGVKHGGNKLEKPWGRTQVTGKRKGISSIMLSIKKTKRGDDGYCNRKAAKKLPSKIAAIERLGVTGGYLQGDGIPEMVLNTKPPNEAELEKLAKPMNDTGETRGPKRLKRFTTFAN